MALSAASGAERGGAGPCGTSQSGTKHEARKASVACLSRVATDRFLAVPRDGPFHCSAPFHSALGPHVVERPAQAPIDERRDEGGVLTP